MRGMGRGLNSSGVLANTFLAIAFAYGTDNPADRFILVDRFVDGAIAVDCFRD
jgi:hypothetical protein